MYFLFCLLVISLSEMFVDDISILVNQVFRWPIAICVGVPGREVIIECDGIEDICFTDSIADIFFEFLEGKFWCMNTDDHESISGVFLVPCIEIGLCADAVDT